MKSPSVPPPSLLMPSPHVDFAAIKERQRATWSSGDYAVVGTTLNIVGEELCETLDLRSMWRVLDVAAGNGNAALAAARRFCDVIASDYVPELLERAKAIAESEHLSLAIREADAEALPFADKSFDAVLSTFGVMFAPNQEQAAAELVRVCKTGGKIGLANWTPGGFIGQLFKTVGWYAPAPAGIRPPSLWGTPDRLNELFAPHQVRIETRKRHFTFRYRSPDHWIETFKTYYGPTLKAFAVLSSNDRSSLEAGMRELIDRHNLAQDGSMVVPSEYLEVVVTRE